MTVKLRGTAMGFGEWRSLRRALVTTLRRMYGRGSVPLAPSVIIFTG